MSQDRATRWQRMSRKQRERLMSAVAAIQTGLDDLDGDAPGRSATPGAQSISCTHKTAARYSVNSAAAEGSRRRSDTDRRRRVLDGCSLRGTFTRSRANVPLRCEMEPPMRTKAMEYSLETRRQEPS